MKVITKYFYENGAEMKQHDIVYLEGEDVESGLWFAGMCRIGFINNELLGIYPLGHSMHSNYFINMHISEITKLIKIENNEIEKLLVQEIKRSLKKDRE